jgi:hypothetical protein
MDSVAGASHISFGFAPKNDKKLSLIDSVAGASHISFGFAPKNDKKLSFFTVLTSYLLPGCP